MKRIRFIVNPISGGKDKSGVLAAIARHLDLSLYVPEILFTTAPGEAESLARNADADVIVAVGGDGTVDEVARGVLGTGKSLGIIPCGSGDGLALHLGISRRPEQAVLTLNEGRTVLADVARMNGKPFFCTAGLGLDARVSMDFAKSTSRGLSQYIALAWEQWKHNPSEHYILDADGLHWEGDAIFLTVANANQWGNQARIAPMASLRDGLLDIIAVLPFHTIEIPDLATRLMTGQAASSRRFLHFSARQLHVERSRSGAVHCDGDPAQGGTAFDFCVEPGVLPILAPASKLSKL